VYTCTVGASSLSTRVCVQATFAIAGSDQVEYCEARCTVVKERCEVFERGAMLDTGVLVLVVVVAAAVEGEAMGVTSTL
jgi:hypothetical protein